MAKKKFAGATGIVSVDVAGGTSYSQVLSCVDVQLPADVRSVVDCQGMDEDDPDPRVGVKEQAEFSFLTHWDPSDSVDASLRTALDAKTKCSWKFASSDGASTKSDTFSGYIAGIEPESIAKDGRTVYRVRVAVSGGLTEGVV